ncbi:DUF4139 domain-containing protein [Dyella jiangningensis]|uniref:DUF4139 domain-containing protein n=1 Tax=Dyella jiangningensis TaxID=1379159 RepID=A0A328P4R4_9GAMM|nr:DUF4139 domain-containing protein [Dyella jiangningensis]RAO75214.1 hypothetical protein CA260_14035 [Dyella jiangningensis]
MRPLPLATLAVAIATTASTGALAASSPATHLTLYRSDDAALFSAGNGGVQAGYAVAREPRELQLKNGVQDISLGGLPQYLDPEAMALSVEGDSAHVLSQRLLLGQGQNAALASLVGQPVSVLGSGGQPLASGTLLRAGDGLLVQGSDGGTSLIREYAAVRAQNSFQTGSLLQLRIDAQRAGTARATLSYTTSGLGWRAAYVGTLQPGDRCQMQFESRASIANRSGRDWKDTQLTLVAGEPNFAKPSAPRPMGAPVAYAMRAKADAAPLPEQDTLADYRTYTLPGAVDLPDGSVSQVPLYATRTIECERTSLFENGGGWVPPQPMINRDFTPGGNGAVTSTLQLRAFDSLPAGYLRVLTADRNGTPQFIGEGRINDTPKGSDAHITLGTAFDLRGERERTAFSVDKASRTLDESFRITLTNAGDSARVVTVREHPSRWRQWTLVSSSSKPSQQTPDTLEFRVTVPAGGKATLDYAVRYQWSAEDHPQG